MLKALARDFLRFTPKTLADLTCAVKQGNATDIRQAAHTIKSAVAFFGAEKAHRSAYTLEKIAHTGNKTEITEQLTLLSREVNALNEALSRFIETESPET